MKNVDDCFERGFLRKVEPSRKKSEQSLLQAREWLYEAEKTWRQKRIDLPFPQLIWLFFIPPEPFSSEMG